MSILGKILSLKHKFEKPFQTLNNIYISKNAVLNNFDIFQSMYPNYEIFPVLKSNAYGHGIKEIATILKQRKITYIVVDSYFEALKIQEINDTKVLLIGYTLIENLKYINFKNISLVVYDIETLKELTKIGKKVNIHIKIDSGMHRQGIYIYELPKLLDIIKIHKHINLEGVCSHLADADGIDNSYSLQQEETFKKGIELIKNYGFSPKYIHLSNSAGSAKLFGNNYCNSIRLGIGLYGVNPLEETDNNYDKLAKLKLALSFYSTLILKKSLKKGEKVSYNGTFTAKYNMTIGIIPVGYYEGLSRKLSNNFEFYYKNSPLKILGRICMNLTVIDLTGIDINVGDKIEIISNSQDKSNNIYNLAEKSENITYECLTRLSESVRREVVE
ncbi:MAG: alanine racemase [Candidatus Gracilibacteria bacterium]